MLAKDIIKSARYTLSDTSMTRWTDERLLNLVNECLDDIALNTVLFNDAIFLGISDNVVDYDLSTYLTKITRVEFLDQEVTFKSFQEMDAKDKDWQLHTGNCPKYIVYSKQRPGQFKIYPIVTNAENRYLVYSSDYGIITAITYSDIQELIVTNYGDLGTLATTGYLKIYGVLKQPYVSDINTTILLDDTIKETMAHFVAGRALRDNTDVQNRTMGAEELAMYAKNIEQYSEAKEKGYIQSQHTSRYITI